MSVFFGTQPSHIENYLFSMSKDRNPTLKFSLPSHFTNLGGAEEERWEEELCINKYLYHFPLPFVITSIYGGLHAPGTVLGAGRLAANLTDPGPRCLQRGQDRLAARNYIQHDHCCRYRPTSNTLVFLF